MTDDLVTRLRERAGKYDEYDWHSDIELEAADRIEKDAQHIDEMYELVAAMNADHTASKTRIEKLEAALREIIGALDDPKGGQHVYDMRNASYIARKALEGKDDPQADL